MKQDLKSSWTTSSAAELYGISNWGAEYFDVSDDGCVMVKACGPQNGKRINLQDIVSGLEKRGLSMPVLLRFGDILAARIKNINEAFENAIREAGYKSVYRGVYPIKVNQQQQVIEEIVEYGAPYHYGLEAGSKPELIAALAYMKDPEAYIVCNGYKDEEFVDLALYAQKLGLKTFLVLEMPGELELVLERAARMGIKPRLGLRAKLATKASGHWVESGGDRSMFGLNAAQIIDVVDHLREHDALDCLQMLHYHLGSQIPDIRSIRQAVHEASRIYVSLVKEGAAMGVLDVGGGLAVDYDGSHTNFASSSNYQVGEYAADIVEAVMKLADEAGVDHPVLVTEAGRATVAHHAVLLFNVLDVTRFESHAVPTELPAGASEALQNLMYVKERLTAKNIQEFYHDAVYYRDELRSQFGHGSITLRERALGERIFWYITRRISDQIAGNDYIPDELQGLEASIADVYHGNFSVFQSLPDAWAIDQLFPIMPIHRLDEFPDRKATLADITCDCDGKISSFIDLHDVKKTLPLHNMNGEDYYLGVFLVGAYQETLGDLHNLLGDTNVASVRIDEEGNIEYDSEVEGDTVAEVLSYVEYNPQELLQRVRNKAEQAVKSGQISPELRREIMAAYQDGLRGYTYFES